MRIRIGSQFQVEIDNCPNCGQQHFLEVQPDYNSYRIIGKATCPTIGAPMVVTVNIHA